MPGKQTGICFTRIARWKDEAGMKDKRNRKIGMTAASIIVGAFLAFTGCGRAGESAEIQNAAAEGDTPINANI